VIFITRKEILDVAPESVDKSLLKIYRAYPFSYQGYWHLTIEGKPICNSCLHSVETWHLPTENRVSVLPYNCPVCSREMENGGEVYNKFIKDN